MLASAGEVEIEERSLSVNARRIVETHFDDSESWIQFPIDRHVANSAAGIICRQLADGVNRIFEGSNFNAG
jgi:hypothetical protein